MSSDKNKSYRWVFIFFLCLYTLTAGGHYYSSDGETIYLVTRAVIRDGTFFILHDNDALPQLALRYGVGMQSAPVVMPAQSVLLAPLYLAGLAASHYMAAQYTNYLLHLFTSFLNVIITAVTVTIFFRFLERLGYGLRASLVTTGIFGLATLVWPYSKFDFSEALLSLCLFGGFYWIYLFRNKALLRYAFLSGVFLGMAEATKVAAAVAVLPIALYFFIIMFSKGKTERPSRFKAAALFISGPAAIAILLGLYNLARFGSITKTGYPSVVFSTPLTVGLYGLLFSTGKGLFIYSPPVVFFFAGIRSFFQKHKAEAVLFLTLMVSGIIFYAKLEAWHGDVAWGPRYIVYLLPFILAPAVEVAAAFRRYRPPWKAAAIVVVTAGVLIQLVAVSVFYNTYLDGMIKKYPEKVASSKLDKFWFEPGFSPLLGEAKILPKRVINYGQFLTGRDYSSVPEETGPLFFWFFSKPVPDFWWAYYSLSSMPRKWLALLLLPLTGLLISGLKLSREMEP